MKLEELLSLTRDTADDAVKNKYLWSDDFIKRALNDAEMEACRRARLIVDTTTDEICRIDLALNQSLYDIDERIIFIRRIKLNSRSKPLGFMRWRDMDAGAPGWEAHTGSLSLWIPDYTTGKLKTYRVPIAAQIPDYLTLTVVRGPLEPMVEPGDSPEIKPRYHYNLHHWALFRMYSQQDTEQADPKRAADNLALFEAEFGPPSPAVQEQWIDANYHYGEEMGVF